MNLIKNNPYRIVGLLAGATAREQSRQINRLKNFIAAEQDPQEDFSFPALGEFHRTIESVEEAASKLNLDNDKINAALFWFWNGNPITDEAAFENLKSGNIEATYEIWDKLITKTDEEGNRFWKPVTEKNYSAFHNFSILNLVKTNGNLRSAVTASLYFLESDLVQKFVSSVVDETYKTKNKDVQLLFLNQLLSDLETNNKKSLSELIDILNTLDFLAKQDFMKVFVQRPIEQIENHIETAKNKRKSSKAYGAKAGEELFTATSNDLSQLKSLVGASDLTYTSISDKVANEILQCSIDYFNYSQEMESSSNYAETAMKLAKQAEVIAIGKLTKDRIKDSIKTLEEMKDREISQAIQVLKSIKDAYETNKAEILAKVRIQEETDVQIFLGKASINWDKVNKIIENSINWDKAVELVNDVVPRHNIEIIKNVKNQAALDEYKSLVNFLLSKLTQSNQNKVNYLRFWAAPNSSSEINWELGRVLPLVVTAIAIIIGLANGFGWASLILGFFALLISIKIADWIK